MKVTRNEFLRRFPNASESAIKKNCIDDQLQGAELERIAGDEPLAAKPRAQESPIRFSVKITSHRKRLIDPDNLSVKAIVDCLRRENFIPDDAAKYIELTVKQVCASRDWTEIEIVRI